jgi:hypothetical protein
MPEKRWLMGMLKCNAMDKVAFLRRRAGRQGTGNQPRKAQLVGKATVTVTG